MPGPLTGPHSGYKTLRCYKMAEIIHDATVAFCKLFVDKRSRTIDQMVQAARSGKQNIAEGSVASGTSKKTELKLINVARASLEELLLDYQDFLRQNNLEQWPKNHTKAIYVRKLCYRSNLSYRTYQKYVENKSPEDSANTIICVIHQANYLLDQLKRQLEQQFVEQGGFTEKLYKIRTTARAQREKSS